MAFASRVGTNAVSPIADAGPGERVARLSFLRPDYACASPGEQAAPGTFMAGSGSCGCMTNERSLPSR
jgi:hypothetical protein